MTSTPPPPQRNLRPFIIASIAIAVASLIVLCMFVVVVAAVNNASR